MCELKIIQNEKTIMQNVVRITIKDDIITLYGMLGEKKEISGKLIDVNLTKQHAIIE